MQHTHGQKYNCTAKTIICLNNAAIKQQIVRSVKKEIAENNVSVQIQPRKLFFQKNHLIKVSQDAFLNKKLLLRLFFQCKIFSFFEKINLISDGNSMLIL